jgi:hypothetical protein
MGLLQEVEAAQCNRRSSMVGRSGVRSELEAMHQSEAIAWLQAHIAPPVSRDWGQLLFVLGADALSLKRWLKLGKEHALAAADALASLIDSGKLDIPIALLPDLRTTVEEHGSPRLKAVLELVEKTQEALSRPLPAKLAKVEALLSNGRGVQPHQKARIISAQGTKSRWHALFQTLGDVYCVTVLDWKASQKEQAESVHALPVWSNTKEPLDVQVVDFGSDEVILVALPAADMQELQQLVAGVRFTSVGLAA